MKKKITFSNSGVSNIKKAEEEVAAKALELLFFCCGATPGEEKGLYSLNGLTDIKQDEMCVIYNQKETIDKLDEWEVLRGNEARTIVPCEKRCGVRLKSKPLKGHYSFAESNLEVLKFSKDQTLDTSKDEELLPVESLEGTFYKSRNLHTIYPLNVATVSEIGSNTFDGCKALKEVRLCNIDSPVRLSSSPLLSYASLLYLIENKKSNTSIRVAVAPHTYKYMIALREPDETVGGTAEEWTSLPQKAQEKGVVFHTPNTIAFVNSTGLNIDKGLVGGETLIIEDSYCSAQNSTLCFP